MPNYVISASDDAVILRNYEGMLVRYQAEDRPNTAQPTQTRGVSALLQGSKSALIPENSERMQRRRQLNVLTNHVSSEDEPCGSACGDKDHAAGHDGSLLPLNGLAKG